MSFELAAASALCAARQARTYSLCATRCACLLGHAPAWRWPRGFGAGVPRVAAGRADEGGGGALAAAAPAAAVAAVMIEQPPAESQGLFVGSCILA